MFTIANIQDRKQTTAEALSFAKAKLMTADSLEELKASYRLALKTATFAQQLIVFAVLLTVEAGQKTRSYVDANFKFANFQQLFETLGFKRPVINENLEAPFCVINTAKSLDTGVNNAVESVINTVQTEVPAVNNDGPATTSSVINETTSLEAALNNDQVPTSIAATTFNNEPTDETLAESVSPATKTKSKTSKETTTARKTRKSTAATTKVEV